MVWARFTRQISNCSDACEEARRAPGFLDAMMFTRLFRSRRMSNLRVEPWSSPRRTFSSRLVGPSRP